MLNENQIIEILRYLEGRLGKTQDAERRYSLTDELLLKDWDFETLSRAMRNLVGREPQQRGLPTIGLINQYYQNAAGVASPKPLKFEGEQGGYWSDTYQWHKDMLQETAEVELSQYSQPAPPAAPAIDYAGSIERARAKLGDKIIDTDSQEESSHENI